MINQSVVDGCRLEIKTTIHRISINFCRLLPEEECREGESVEEFAERVRKNIADSLSVPLTEFTWSDKQELVKRLEEEEKARRQEEQSEY